MTYKSYTGSQYLTMVAAVHLHPMSETQERRCSLVQRENIDGVIRQDWCLLTITGD